MVKEKRGLLNIVDMIRALGFDIVYSDESGVERYYKSKDDHLVTIEPIIIDGEEDWYVFSEEGKTSIDEQGMEYHLRVGLSVAEAVAFAARAYEIRQETRITRYYKKEFDELREELAKRNA